MKKEGYDKKKVKKFGILLFVVARTAFWIIQPVFVIWAVCSLTIFNKKDIKTRFSDISEYFHDSAFGIDQLGNVMGAPIMNDLLLTKMAKKLYGNVDETISHVTGINHQDKTLTLFGIGVARMLNNVDPSHVQKAAVTDQDNTEQKE